MSTSKICFKFSLTLIALVFFAHPSGIFAAPASQNYELKDYTFGAGGSTDSASAAYRLFGVVGEVESGRSVSAGYQANTGLVYTVLVNLPPAPSFTNQSDSYNRLHLVINPGGNPSDTLFAVAISTDNFASDTRYVQSDATVGSDLGSEDWQTYLGWGGAVGIDVIGLAQNTTYTVRVTASQGDFTAYRFGPTASAATTVPSISFDIDVSVADADTNPPFSIDFGDLYIGTVTSSPKRIWVDLTTNGTSGGKVYVYGHNAGLSSISRSYTISSTTADLSTAPEGFGAQGVSATQTSGGPINIQSPYSGTNQVVGITDTNIREIFSSSAPVFGGRASFSLKAKSSSQTPIADDYTETLTVIAAGNY